MRFFSFTTVPFWGLTCLITAGFFSQGFHHFDEHFQILEFAALKLGLTTESNLPWEFHEKMRSSLQPWMVVGLHRLLNPFHADNPFWITTLLRIISGLFSWSATLLLLKTFRDEIQQKWLEHWVIPFAFLFSLAVYNGVRFSSENWGAFFFVFGLCLVHTPNRNISNKESIAAGFLLGLSFLCRFQMALMIFGLVIWLVVVKKEGFARLGLVAMGILSALIFGLVLDHFFYGGWPITFWNYLDLNLLQGKAATFGVSPWYEYLRLLLIYLIPPFSLVFLSGIVLFFWLYPTHVVSFSLIPFLFVQSLIGHKEIRFLFPLVYFLPLLLGLSFQGVVEKRARFALTSCWSKILKKTFWIVNSLILIAVMLHPADKDVALYKAIYHSGARKLVYLEEDPFLRAGAPIRYYLNPALKISPSSQDFETIHEKVRTLVVSRNPSLIISEEKCLHRHAPAWLTFFDFNHWLSRTRFWRAFWLES